MINGTLKYHSIFSQGQRINLISEKFNFKNKLLLDNSQIEMYQLEYKLNERINCFNLSIITLLYPFTTM